MSRPSLATHLLNTEESLKQERVRELVQRLVESIRHRREREENEERERGGVARRRAKGRTELSTSSNVIAVNLVNVHNFY